MRDLTARLRDIVRRDPGGARPAEPRELTYVPDTAEAAIEPARAAAILGGAPLEDSRESCLVIDRVLEADQSHGRRDVGSYAPSADAPLALFDSRAGSRPEWADRVVFFDLETTGLSGGAGTLAFLAGCGWFENGAFRVRQFFLAGPSGERSMLNALSRIFDEASPNGWRFHWRPPNCRTFPSLQGSAG